MASFLCRVMEIILMFLLVWYYCTLTIRESILKVNGSRIKGWWRFHHFMSTVISGVLLIWPNNQPWYLFRQQFMYFNVFISEYWCNLKCITETIVDTQRLILVLRNCSASMSIGNYLTLSVIEKIFFRS